MHMVIRKQSCPPICLNDTKVLGEREFMKLQKKLKDDFDVILPVKSDIENDDL